MPAFIELLPGMQVHVMPHDGALSSAYESVIRQVTGQSVRMDLPRYGDEPMPVTPGEDLTLFVEVAGRIYRLASRVQKVEVLPRESVIIEQPSEADHAERRQFYRLMTVIAPRYSARISDAGEELERLDVRVLDMSGGGLQLHVRRWVPVGARMRLIFALDDDPLEIDGSLVALSVVRPGPRSAFYRVHGRFVDLSRVERERLVRFIFRKQVDFRKRGVG